MNEQYENIVSTGTVYLENNDFGSLYDTFYKIADGLLASLSGASNSESGFYPVSTSSSGQDYDTITDFFYSIERFASEFASKIFSMFQGNNAGGTVSGEEIGEVTDVTGDDELNIADNGSENIGDATDDELTIADGGNDIVSDGSGDEAVFSKFDDNIYKFSLGDGDYIIDEDMSNSPADAIVFGEGIAPSDIRISKDKGDMILNVGPAGDSIRIVNQYDRKDSIVEYFRFADGTVLTAEKLFYTPLDIKGDGDVYDFPTEFGIKDNNLIGGDNDDSLHAGEGNDTLTGGAGNDLLSGG
ncbi:MAG: hypothetical protein J6U00_03810, partial [Ruminococcus sp.]|uniref:calcium-binding protein n=1 Tax=Ruminococcus sp. TaxID=41978 RepID=UPI001B2D82FB